MVILRKKELKGMNEKELNKRLKDLKIELMKNNAQRASNQSTGKIKEIRRTMARLIALLKEKQKQEK